MLCPLDPELRHLAFDHPGVGTEPAGWEHLEEDLTGGLRLGISQHQRGKSPDATPWCGVPPGGCG